jgi:hypothetical protein
LASLGNGHCCRSIACASRFSRLSLSVAARIHGRRLGRAVSLDGWGR